MSLRFLHVGVILLPWFGPDILCLDVCVWSEPVLCVRGQAQGSAANHRPITKRGPHQCSGPLLASMREKEIRKAQNITFQAASYQDHVAVHSYILLICSSLFFFPFSFQTTSCTPEIIVSLSTQLLLSDISRKLSSISHVSAPTTTATTTASIASTILAVILHPAALLPKGSLVPFSFLHFVLSTSRHRPCNLGPNGSSHP